MKCMEAQQLVNAYLNHELDEKHLEQFLDHVDGCQECREELEIYFTIYETIDSDSQNQQEDAQRYNVIESLARRIRDDRVMLKRKKNGRVVRYAFVALAELVLIFLLAFGTEFTREHSGDKTAVYQVIRERRPVQSVMVREEFQNERESSAD